MHLNYEITQGCAVGEHPKLARLRINSSEDGLRMVLVFYSDHALWSDCTVREDRRTEQKPNVEALVDMLKRVSNRSGAKR